MAPPAADTTSSAATDWLHLLAPEPGRLEFAARLALVCTLTVMVTVLYGTPEPALTAYVAFFLVKRDRASSLLLCVAAALLITLLIGFVFVVANATLERPPWRVASMTVIAFGLLFLVSASKLGAGGGIFALIVAYALDVLGRVPFGELATRGLLYAWLFVGIPAAVGAVVALLIAPSPRQLVQRALAHRLRLVSAMLRGGDAQAAHAFADHVREGDGEVRTWLKLAGAERTSPASEMAGLRQAAGSTAALMSLTAFALQTPQAQPPLEAREAIARSVDARAQEITGGRLFAPGPAAADLANTLPAATLAARVQRAFEALLARFTRPAQQVAPAAQPERGGFLRPDAFTNTDHVRFALKTTGAAMFCYLLYSLLNWPTIHTCFITVFIVSLGTVAESVEKLSLRIAGALVGAVLGLVTLLYVVPSLTSIGGLMAAVFAGTLLAAWVAAGSPRIAYAGFQIGFAFLLCAVQGPGPSFDMLTIRDRIIGILIGNLVAYVVSAHFWPLGVAQRIESGIAGLLERMAAETRGGARPTEAAGEWLGRLGAIESDLDIARYEPDSVRPADEWLAHRRGVVRQLGALQEPLALLASESELCAFQPRLDRIAGAPVDAPEASPMPDMHDPLAALVDQRLHDLETALAASEPSDTARVETSPERPHAAA
ncbi:multidrug resistance protein MdtO [Variovorax sp. HW608]|uniref:FUSC family protein n=1 Tax=Variovorax sp. HW608 TaxID=1034889 RepID=UPI0008201918|nr:FUSC family protein [Variovorax sp. HW608]SCK25732.1 multidrug resistance protein MdtO [Variovorax sp. HW608]